MGVFFETSSIKPQIAEAVNEALLAPAADPADAVNRAHAKADEIVGADKQLQVGRLLIALAIVGALLGMAIGTDAAGLANSSKSLYALATTAFGIVVGLLGGENQKS